MTMRDPFQYTESINNINVGTWKTAGKFDRSKRSLTFRHCKCASAASLLAGKLRVRGGGGGGGPGALDADMQDFREQMGGDGEESEENDLFWKEEKEDGGQLLTTFTSC